jgi:hypothetical protein
MTHVNFRESVKRLMLHHVLWPRADATKNTITSVPSVFPFGSEVGDAGAISFHGRVVQQLHSRSIVSDPCCTALYGFRGALKAKSLRADI